MALAASVDSARALMKAGRTVEALREIETLQAQAAEDPNVKFAIGEMLQELAAARAEQLVKIAPESPQAHELIGKSLEAHGKLEEAAAQYKIALDKAPDLPGIAFLIGNVRWKLRDFDAAKPMLEQELRLNPAHPLANLRMGQISLATNPDEPERAIVYLQKAVLDPHAALDARRELGKAFRLAGRYQQALEQLRIVEQQVPGDSSIHAQLATVYRAMGDSAGVEREMQLQRKILEDKRLASQKLHQQKLVK